ncbi:MAG: endopeptidase La [Ignavibacteriae bacterium]|nr:endopeptidase La [Ignavibacteriota bacterium]
MPKKQPADTDSAPDIIPDVLPLLPLRDVVIFPHMIFPVLIGREGSVLSVTRSIEGDKYIFVCPQKDAAIEDPEPRDLHRGGTIAKILQVLKLPNGLMKVLVDGLAQGMIEEHLPDDGNGARVRVRQLARRPRLTTRLRAYVRQLDVLFGEYVRLHRNIPNETLIAFEGLDDAQRKVYYAAANMHADVATKMAILEMEDLQAQYEEAVRVLRAEIAIMKMEVEIDNKVHDNIQRSQRKYFIQEQIRILQTELDEDEAEPGNEYEALRARIATSAMSDDARRKANEELDKLQRMPGMSPEATVARNYLDWLLAMPWGVYTDDNLSIVNARAVLDTDHYGLDKPKQRILEHIAVLNLVGEIKGQILCFVGPPGVGKTSLGKSIARAMNRAFVRIALGGVHDEAEIRGHRRTYIGSMPGKIAQAIKKAGSANPVVLLDEIDKMSSDFHGDPASAMLEVLDPEQNNTFNDHYLDVDFDLSKVLFITTANVRYGIPLPLQDRMEIIELPGYLEHEKLEIAKRHLVNKQIALHGLASRRLRFEDRSLMKIIREYTLEAGVRNLERDIATICRKTARSVVEEDAAAKKKQPRTAHTITPALVEEYLGVPKQRPKKRQGDKVGSVTGLAWTSVGGDILHVDVTLMRGAEKLTLTGQLGDVMKESAHAALSWLRSNTDRLGIPEGAFEKREIHVHIPEGAIPKDGPSAGLTLTMSMLSAVRGIPARGDVAMTGEITLHGDVLAIGGLNEKLLAARRHGIRTVLLPKDNEPDLRDVPPAIAQGMKLIFVGHIDEAIQHVFRPLPRAGRRIS